MDDAQRLIRRVRVVLRISQWILLLYVIAGGLRMYWSRTAPDAFEEPKLAESNYALFTAFSDYADDLKRDLVLLPPPTDTAKRSAWVDSLQIRAGKDASVFLVCGTSVEWVRRSTNAADATNLETRIADSTKKLAQYTGFVLNKTMWTQFGKDYDHVPTATIVEMPDNPVAWGVLYRRIDLWRPFFERLKRAQEVKSGQMPDPLASRLSISLQVQRLRVRNTDWSNRTTFRASVDGEVLYASPGLDTTARSKIDTTEGARVEYYVSAQDRVYSMLMGGGRFPWLGLALLVLLFAGNQLSYHWLKKAGMKKQPFTPVEP